MLRRYREVNFHYKWPQTPGEIVIVSTEAAEVLQFSFPQHDGKALPHENTF